MKKLHIFANEMKPGAVRARLDVRERMAALGLTEVVSGEAEAVLALGGDGTLLRAVHQFPGLPVLGLNFGGLGYLSSVGANGFSAALALLAADRFRISRRTMLAVSRDGCVLREALNDIVVMREGSGHAARLDLAADGRLATRYMADGLIFATPTGSTAYSLSAGGPVLLPDSSSLVVTPLNPHALSVRPVVVRDSVRFTVTAAPRSAGNALKLGVSADGESVFTLSEGETVEVAKSSATARLIELDGYDPYEVLAKKLGWSGTCV